MNKRGKKTLAEMGEFRLIDEVILPLARAADPNTSIGDDCAFIKSGDHILAATADVGPRPLIQNLAAHRDDWEAAGWMAVVATASDIASAGAKPLFLTNCIDAPPDLEVSVLESFVKGYFRALTEFGFANGGGDLRHGPALSARVFGVGLVEHGNHIRRSGAKPLDHLVVIGPAGSFMANYILASKAAKVAKEALSTGGIPNSLRFPVPQLREMQCLAREGIVKAASDTSDGLLGAIENIGKGSGCGFHLQLNISMCSEEVRNASNVSGVASPWNLFFAWGDWSVAAVIDNSRIKEFETTCLKNGIEWRALGRVVKDAGRLTATIDDKDEVMDVVLVRNENFIDRGFNAGIEGHLDYILGTSIFIEDTV